MNESISLGEAFKYCGSLTSYWVWIGVFALALILGLLVINRVAAKGNKDLDKLKLFWFIVFLFLTAGAIFKNPVNVAANTTKAQAAKGIYIGF